MLANLLFSGGCVCETTPGLCTTKLTEVEEARAAVVAATNTEEGSSRRIVLVVVAVARQTSQQSAGDGVASTSSRA